MNFKSYLAEAEWIQGQRHPTIEALWHILQPLSNSKYHLLAINEIGARRDEPLSMGTNYPYFRAAGVRAFMRDGLSVFGEKLEDTKRVILHILRVNSLQGVWVMDPRINEQNPWLTMKTHWQDMEKEVAKLLPGSAASGAKENWENLQARFNNVYREGPGGYDFELGNPESMMPRLEQLHHLVYVEAPRLLKFMKSNWSWNPAGTAGSRVGVKYLYQSPTVGPLAYDLHYPKRMGFDIISKTMPLTETPWAIILNTRAVQTQNTVELPADFKGFERPQKDSKSFYAPDASKVQAGKIYDELQEKFRELAGGLEDLLATMDAVAEDNAAQTELNRGVKDITTQIQTMEKSIKRLEAMKQWQLPPEWKDTIKQFEDQGRHMIAHLEDRERYDDEEDEDNLGYGRQHYNIEPVSRALGAVTDELSALTHRA